MQDHGKNCVILPVSVEVRAGPILVGLSVQSATRWLKMGHLHCLNVRRTEGET